MPKLIGAAMASVPPEAGHAPGGAFDGVVHFRQRRPKPECQFLRAFRWRDASGMAPEQRGAESRLEVADALADHRFRQVGACGGA
jgi:hypothetical protein